MAEVAYTGLAVVVPEADPIVGLWRDRWDSAAALGVPAHVTVLGPFVPPPVPADVVAALRSFVAGVAPWTTTYARLDRFPGGVLYVAPEPAEPFVALIELLVARWPEYPPYGGEFDTVVPHLTVCDGAPDHVMEAAALAVAPHLPLVVPTTELLLFEQAAPGGPYAVTARLPFAG